MNRTNDSKIQDVNLVNKTSIGDVTEDGKFAKESMVTFISVFLVGCVIVGAFYTWNKSMRRKRKGYMSTYQYSKLSQFDNHDDEEEMEDVESIRDLKGGDDTSSSDNDCNDDKPTFMRGTGVPKYTSNGLEAIGIPSDNLQISTSSGMENNPATLSVSSTTATIVPNGNQRISQSSMHTDSDEELLH